MSIKVLIAGINGLMESMTLHAPLIQVGGYLKSPKSFHHELLVLGIQSSQSLFGVIRELVESFLFLLLKFLVFPLHYYLLMQEMSNSYHQPQEASNDDNYH